MGGPPARIAMQNIALTIYFGSIVTLLYRGWTKGARLDIFEDPIDAFFILVMVFCPVLNTCGAIMAVIAILEERE